MYEEVINMFNGYYDKKTVNEGEKKEEFNKDFIKELARKTLAEAVKKKEIVTATVIGVGTLVVKPVVKTVVSKIILPAINIASPAIAVVGAVGLVVGAFHFFGKLFGMH
jgi:predicted transcriptional regulator